MKPVLKTALVGFLLLSALAGISLGVYSRRKAPAPAGSGAAAPSAARRPAAPDFSLRDLNGRAVSLKDFRGKVVMLDFWATWCGPCRESIPVLKALREKYGPQGFEVVGLSVDEVPEDVAEFVARHGVKYPVALESGSGVAGQYGVSGIPATFLLDADGAVVDRWVGYAPHIGAQWESKARSLLKQTEG